jgi:hypothetical protein
MSRRRFPTCDAGANCTQMIVVANSQESRHIDAVSAWSCGGGIYCFRTVFHVFHRVGFG